MMKINMQFIALALALLFLNVNGASAQDRSYEGTIRICLLYTSDAADEP